MLKQLVIAAAFLVIILVAGACAPKPQSANIKIIVDIEKTEDHAEYPGEFWPEHAVLRKGTTVIWTNTDSKEHTVTSGNLFNRTLSPGASFSQTFKDTGNFTYRCQLFPDMIGTIIVE